MGTVHAKSELTGNESTATTQKYAGSQEKSPASEEIRFDNVSARVDRINVDGLARTKNDIVEDCIKELFDARNFQDVLLKAHRIRLKLDELGCFKNIGVYIDTSKGPNATPNGFEVTFNVKEFRRITGGVTTQVGNNEGSLLVGLRAPNIFGRGEKVQVEYSHGSKKTSNFHVGYIKPFKGKHRAMFTTSLFQAHSESPSSGYKLLERGILCDLGFTSSPLIKHNLQWEGNIRDLNVLTRNSSFEVREQAGLNLKSSIRHILSIDLRDDLIFPSCGSLFRLNTDLAGLGGDVGFIKNDVFVQGNYSILDGFVLQGSFTGGFMTGLHNDMKISISDLYYLGGPMSVRGFEPRGIGPHADGDSLGSLSHWAAGLHLFTPLPFRPGKGGFGDLFRSHFFVNCGNVGMAQEFDKHILEALKDNLRISYGVGVALRLGNIARLEVNYCYPFAYDKGDQIHPGVQFGIGVQFL